MSEYVKGELIYYAHTLSRKFKELIIYPISDIHIGNPMFSKHHFNKTMDFVLSHDNCFVILNGDLAECVTKDSKGNIWKQTMPPAQQKKELKKLLKPLKGRVLGCTMGNHEERIADKCSFDITGEIAEELGCPYRPAGILLKVTFGDGNNRSQGQPYTYFIYATHGYGGARTKGAKAAKIERPSAWIHADAYIMSHDHETALLPAVYLMPDPRTHLDEDTGFRIGKVKSTNKKLVKSHAYLKWGEYAEAKGHGPVSLEPSFLKLQGTGKPAVHAEMW